MICKKCGLEFDEDSFPKCPYCGNEYAELRIESKEGPIESDSDFSQSQNDAMKTNCDEIIEDYNEKEEPTTLQINDDFDLSIIYDDAMEKSFEEDKKREITQNLHISLVPELSRKTKLALQRNGINTVKELQECILTKNIKLLKGFGDKCLSDIQKYIDVYDIQNASFSSEKGQDRKPIQHIFFDDEIFCQFCNKLNIKYLDEITSDVFVKLSKQPYIRKAKLESIKNRYNEAIKQYSGIKNDYSEENKDLVYPFSNINKEVAELPIDALSFYGVKNNVINLLSNKGYKKIEDLSMQPCNAITILDNRNETALFELSAHLEANIFYIINKNLLHEDEKTIKIVSYRADGYTLQEIGDIFDVTRERIRQIEAKFVQRYINFFKYAFKILYKDDLIPIQNYESMVDNKIDPKIITHILKKTDKYDYLEFNEYFAKKGTLGQLKEIIIDFIEDNSDLAGNYDELNIILENSGFSYITYDDCVSYAQTLGFVNYNGHLFNRRKKYGHVLEDIVEKYYPNGINIYDDKELNNIRSLMKDVYGIEHSETNKALSARLIGSNSVLCDKGTYILGSSIKYNREDFKQIVEQINSSQRKEMYYIDLFAANEGYLKAIGVNNYYFLHGLLKYFFADEFNFSQRDRIQKTGEGLKPGKTKDVISELIIEKGKAVTRKEIAIAMPGISDASLYNVLLEPNADIFIWENKKYFMVSLIEQKDYYIDILSQIIEDLLSKYKICSIYNVYKEFQKDNMHFINKYEINVLNLYYMCAKLLKDKFGFSKPLISHKDVINDNFKNETAVYELLGYPDRMKYKDFRNVISNLELPESTISMILLTVIDKDYFMVDSENYIKKDTLNIGEDIIEEIDKTIKNNMNYDYFCISDESIYNILPKIEYAWTPHLLKSIIAKYLTKYKILEPSMADRRYVRAIATPTESKYSTYADVIYEFLKNRNIKEITLDKLNNMLSINNLCYRHVPFDFFEHPNVSKKDDIITIEIK